MVKPGKGLQPFRAPRRERKRPQPGVGCGRIGSPAAGGSAHLTARNLSEKPGKPFQEHCGDATETRILAPGGAHGSQIAGGRPP